MNNIAILIPCYNEEKTLAQVLVNAKKAFPEAAVYVFDNNSTDSSALIAREHGAFVIPVKEQGKGHVVKQMFASIDCDCAIMVDADATYDLFDAKKMAAMVLQGEADMVLGDRLSGEYFQENKRPFHNFGNSLVRFLINKLFNGHIDDAMTGLRAFSPSFMKAFVPRSPGFQIETEMDIFALSHGFKIASIQAHYQDRPVDSPSKLNTYRDGARVLKLIFASFFRLRPFLAFAWLSLPFFLLAIELGIYPLRQAIDGEAVNLGLGYSSLALLVIAVALALTGLILWLAKKNPHSPED